MPKRTRKEKLLAQQRRSSLPDVVAHSTPSELAKPVSTTYQFQLHTNKKQQKETEENTIELGAIKHDLYKTILLAICAFGIELYVYWLLQIK